MKRGLIIVLFLLVFGALLIVGCHKNPANETPTDENGDPILVDIGGQFQLTLPYFELSLDRVPIIFRGQFVSPEGKREYLERLAVEATFYLEGKRRKYYRKKSYQRTLELRLYAGVLKEYRQDLAKNVEVSEDEIKAEYERTVNEKWRKEKPYENYREGIRRGLELKKVEEAYQQKKQELLEQWKVVLHDDLLDRLDPEKTPPDQYPKLDDLLAESQAEGIDYKYTVGQLLKRIDEAPEHAKEKLRKNKDPKKMLEFVVGEDVLFTWAVQKGFDKTATYALRKKISEVAVLSLVTRREIVADDIEATQQEAKQYFEAHPEIFQRGNLERTWEEAQGEAMRRATEDKRLEAMRSLAKSLMRHRYPTTYYEANIKAYLK